MKPDYKRALWWAGLPSHAPYCDCNECNLAATLRHVKWRLRGAVEHIEPYEAVDALRSLLADFDGPAEEPEAWCGSWTCTWSGPESSVLADPDLGDPVCPECGDHSINFQEEDPKFYRRSKPEQREEVPPLVLIEECFDFKHRDAILNHERRLRWLERKEAGE